MHAVSAPGLTSSASGSPVAAAVALGSALGPSPGLGLACALAGALAAADDVGVVPAVGGGLDVHAPAINAAPRTRAMAFTGAV